MSEVDDLIAFLVERVEEDRAAARHHDQEDSASAGGWSWLRVLTECNVKRDLIEVASALDYLREINDPKAPRDEVGEQILRLLAMPYAGHPDYRPQWHPDADELPRGQYGPTADYGDQRDSPR